MDFAIVLMSSVSLGIACSALAGDRNRGRIFWGVLGTLFFFWPLILLLLFGKKETYKNDVEEAEAIMRRQRGSS